MASAKLTADLLARKGGARPTGKWLRSAPLVVHHNNGEAAQSSGGMQSKPEAIREAEKQTRSDTAAKAVQAEVRIHKSMYLNASSSKQLKLLAARQDTSQQALMEKAIQRFLAAELENADCICGSEF